MHPDMVDALVPSFKCYLQNNVDRSGRWSMADEISTLTQNTEIYWAKHQTIITGRDKIRLMGWNDAITDSSELSTWALSSAAGQGVYVPLWSTIVMTGISLPQMSWWNFPSGTEFETFVSTLANTEVDVTVPPCTTTRDSIGNEHGDLLVVVAESVGCKGSR